jgi:uncharacterized SAM-binding protein YcdF (DUF218 family)
MIKFIIDPFNILLFLILLSFVSIWRKQRALSKWLSITILWFLIISTPLVPGLILNSLENRYPPITAEQLSVAETDGQYHIVVLGGGHGFDDRLPPNSLLSTQALARLSEGIRIHIQLSNSILVLSGYSSSGRTTQAEMLQQTAVLLGVDPEKTITQKEPANTYEEGKVYAERFAGSKKVILVTSAAHMPRAVGVFHHFGINVMPSPAHFRIIGGQRIKWIGFPSIRNISLFRTGLNEYAALVRDSILMN